ncbi:MAG: hypothetical protein CMF96_09830 [Candidatus Marinimicrobia bacterium]|nr:hypothetical protein [Candidatus Neomarinimicrobiota bacterium]|tara:strand:- start:8316 stop:9092 length:777 start_codon:yes stop_codon:yes gene_type:complete
MMDQILEFININNQIEFLVSFDDGTGPNSTYTCNEWGNLYNELGEYGNQPIILNGDDDYNQDGDPDHHLWNSFAGNSYSAYVMLDHHMVVRYLFDIPDLYQFQYNYLTSLMNAMNGCTEQSACNYSHTAIYNDGTCQFDQECDENLNPCSNFSSHLDCISESNCFWMGDHCMEGSNCTDPIAENFNPIAETTGINDNIECIYSPFIEFGCIYPSAVNFNSEARIDDGTCQFNYNDVNEDNIVDILDIIIILSEIIELE